MKNAYDAEYQQIRQEEAGHRDQRVGQEGCRAIEGRATLDGGLDAGRKRQGPDYHGRAAEQRQRVEQALPNLRQDGQAILERLQVAGEEIAKQVDVLQVD